MSLLFSPDYLQSVAWLYGLNTQAASNARVLELGCSNGAALAALAAQWPTGQFVGIELNSESSATELHAVPSETNLQLLAVSLDDLLASRLGLFDYIVIHGTFSQLGNAITDAVLQFCRQHLDDRGVIACSWRCSPGAKRFDVIRDAAQYHSGFAETESQQVASTRAMLGWMSLTQQADVAEFENCSDTLLSHIFLQNQNESSYLIEFNSRIENLSLCYVGDLQPATELPGHYGDRIGQLVDTICPQPHKILTQQYLDFAVDRVERFTLLTHAAHASCINTLPDTVRLVDMRWAGSFRRVIKNNQIQEVLETSDGTSIRIDNPMAQLILEVLGDAWPVSMSREQLLFHVTLPDEEKDYETKLDEALRELFVRQIPGLHFRKGGDSYLDASSPVVTSIDAVFTRAGVNLWGEDVALTSDEKRLLLSGIPELPCEEDFFSITGLIRKGMLIAAPFAWLRYLQRLLRIAPSEHVDHLAMSLFLFAAEPTQGGFLSEQQVNRGKTHRDKYAPDLTPTPQSIVNKAAGYEAQGRYDLACDVYQGYVNVYPDRAYGYFRLANLNILRRDYDEALQGFKQLISRLPSEWVHYYGLVNLRCNQQMYWQTGRLVRALLRVKPNHTLSWDVLGTILRKFNKLKGAEYCARKATSLDPLNITVAANLAFTLCDAAKNDDAIRQLRNVLALDNDNFAAFTGLLFELTHVSSITAAELFAEHLQFGKQVDKWVARQNVKFIFDCSRDVERKLRIGFVSGDLYEHPVSNFLQPFWDNIDRSRYELIAYSAKKQHDTKTDHFKKTATLWRDVDEINDVALAKLIHADKIDVLFDLSGHTASNRLPAFALRPAPVQISWIGYPGTTGLKQMDYRMFTASLAGITGLEQQLTEKIIFAEMQKVFEPSPLSPAVNTLPALRNGYMTYATFNRPKKINDDVLTAWGELLSRSPESTLLLGFMTDDEFIASVKSRLLAKGAHADQLIFRGKVSLQEYLGFHHEIDILLDSFPYTGGTTTNHGAWMGVPTLTIMGSTPPGHQGVDIMRSYGLEQFIAKDVKDYITKALWWGEHPEELNEIRMGMRAKIPTEHESGFNVAATFEKSIREAWRIWCQGESPRTFVVNE